MRVVVTGASGLVGRAAVRRFRATGLTHRDLDITDAGGVEQAVRGVDLIINCAVVGVGARSPSRTAPAIHADARNATAV
ncbi:MAG TPA: NAD-dependent epimerase/dehydratase family protein [Thermoanaerobaculia bacterium]|nr:NAD-dependent epimerase/dehydratase family protein [Thermoanaerobaculia bacterium]